MYRVGYIDDIPEQFENYERKLRREGLELVEFEVSPDKARYIDQIFSHQVQALLVDYKMVNKTGHNGTTLISYFNDMIPDLPCFILTAVDPTHITDKLVTDGQIYSKGIFDTEANNPDRRKAFEKFVEHLKNSAEVFLSRQKLKCEEYQQLLKKKETGLSVSEEESFARLYRALSSYGMVEKLPECFLRSGFEQDLDALLRTGEKLLREK